MILPGKGVIVPLNMIKTICLESNLRVLWATIESDPPKNDFKSDGCSIWPDNWTGYDLYPACFLHDLKYWCGLPNDEEARMLADLELAIDVLRITGLPTLAMLMLQGVRVGGNELFRQRFSWGFGRM